MMGALATVVLRFSDGVWLCTEDDGRLGHRSFESCGFQMGFGCVLTDFGF